MESGCNGTRGGLSGCLTEIDLIKLCLKYPKYTKELPLFKDINAKSSNEDDPYQI